MEDEAHYFNYENDPENDPVIIPLDRYREQPFAPSEIEERNELSPIEKLEKASAAITLYQTFGLVSHIDSLRDVYEQVRPPKKPEGQQDLQTTQARDYYARFMTLATIVDPKTKQEVLDPTTNKPLLIEKQLAAAQRIWERLQPTAVVLHRIIDGQPHTATEEKYYHHAVKILDKLAEEVKLGNVWFK